MKTLSNAVMAVLLAGGATVALTQPAVAAKKEEQKGDQLKLSNEVRGPAAQAQTALAAKDVATATPLVAAVEAAAKTDDEKYIAAALRLNLEVIRPEGANNAALVAPLDALIASPRTPQADKARYTYQRGVIAANAKDPAGAMRFFEQAQQLGYADPNLPLQLVKLKMDSGDIAGGSAALAKLVDAQMAAGQKPSEDIFRYAIARNNSAKNTAEARAWMRRYLTAYPTAKNWRDMLVFWGIQPQSMVPLDKAQKVDLYRLLRAGKALADQYDYEIYAQWTFDQGLPWESKAVLTEGKAAGKIPANSPDAGSLLAAANKSISNEGSMASVEARALKAADGKLAASTADAYLGSGEYAKAITLYRAALEKGGVDANTVNTRLGIALYNSGDKAAAKTAFQAVTGSPRADIAGWWIDLIDHPPVG
ncbi:tetratricopeptide repeat protein [Sphingomonas endophytica]|uniref:Tetratricopeptide repeat family protein n=1 Tax=Sphingomonas endophytica TaxID=869719 RepID=A0A147IA61_9SPHN|nr:hypothetical protein [Sphingomonas endophytica]KTT76751.1 tetratricopeptide repeat family protein [Sphingomonas endophytica]